MNPPIGDATAVRAVQGLTAELLGTRMEDTVNDETERALSPANGEDPFDLTALIGREPQQR
jgi:hypothetical protein